MDSRGWWGPEVLYEEGDEDEDEEDEDEDEDDEDEEEEEEETASTYPSSTMRVAVGSVKSLATPVVFFDLGSSVLETGYSPSGYDTSHSFTKLNTCAKTTLVNLSAHS